jgi:hypothetical protein
MSRVGQCWVGCRANAKMLVASGMPGEKVRVVPCPHFPDDPHLALQRRPRVGGASSPVRFYHIGKWEPRKAQDKIIEVFLLAFKPGEPAILSLRTGKLASLVEGYPQSPDEALVQLLKADEIRERGWTERNVIKHVRLYRERMTEEQLLILHKEGDVYVTLSRGEGFDMPAMDAKLSGNLMLYTFSGGPQDFDGERDQGTPTTRMIPAHPMYEWNDTKYLDFDLHDAAHRMRVLYDLVRSGEHDRTPGLDLEPFTAASVGGLMVAHLTELQEQAKEAVARHAEWVTLVGEERRAKEER